jgi:hypothetical protein
MCDARKLPQGRVGHLAALPYADLPAFMESLSARPGTAAQVIQMIVLCASRQGAVEPLLRSRSQKGDYVFLSPLPGQPRR